MSYIDPPHQGLTVDPRQFAQSIDPDRRMHLEDHQNDLALAIAECDELVHAFAIRIGAILVEPPHERGGPSDQPALATAGPSSSLALRTFEQAVTVRGISAFIRAILDQVDLTDTF